jgi:hypothetical protein
VEATPNGFPKLAAFQSSEANFSLYRSFSYLHSRILLDLQDEITSLEKELDELDLDDAEDEPNRLKSRELDVIRASIDANPRNRRVILREIKDRLMEYGMLLGMTMIHHACANTKSRRSPHQSPRSRVVPKAL